VVIWSPMAFRRSPLSETWPVPTSVNGPVTSLRILHTQGRVPEIGRDQRIDCTIPLAFRTIRWQRHAAASPHRKVPRSFRCAREACEWRRKWQGSGSHLFSFGGPSRVIVMKLERRANWMEGVLGHDWATDGK
jgi:hypothetical protein